MKKGICSLVVGIILMVVITLVAERIVVREGYVESVEKGIVTIVSLEGTAWEWSEDKEGEYKEGAHVRLVMNNKGTERYIEDDIIEFIIRLDK